MNEITCTNCRSETAIEVNVTNHAEAYYCRACDTPVNPGTWPCPRCETDDPVFRNPFTDPCEYYCYECDMAFNRLGPSFEPETVAYGTADEAFDTATTRLELDVAAVSNTPRGCHEYELTLHNAGADPIGTWGRQAIAIQHQVTESDWWTLHGNPDRQPPAMKTTLQPGQTLRWYLNIHTEGIQGPGFVVDREPLPSGPYRFVYWGIPETDVALAVRRSIDFDYGW